MARKKKHEDHVNHEAWAIPYGDLVTLLWALFTVMYAMSSVNEGKFRVLSDSLIAAFHGSPKSMRPINIGDKEPGKGGDKPLVGVTPTVLLKVPVATARESQPRSTEAHSQEVAVMLRLEHQVQDAMQALIDAQLVTVKRESLWLEIEINTDILFQSGASEFAPEANPVLDKLAEVLKPFPNPIRVEGHTDDRPIRTAAFPSNWELSAARAASVVHEFTKAGIDPMRLEIVGFGQYHPRRPNDSPEGRNANRRVAILVLEAVAPQTPAYGTKAGEPPPASLDPAAASSTSAVADKADPGAGKSDEKSDPATAKGGRETMTMADAAGAENRLLFRVPASALHPTVPIPATSPPHDPSPP